MNSLKFTMVRLISMACAAAGGFYTFGGKPLVGIPLLLVTACCLTWMIKTINKQEGC